MTTLLEARSAELREKAMRLQLDAAFAFCSTAGTAFILGRVQNARAAIANARHTAETVHLHLAEPHHVPADSVASIADRLAQLENEISGLEGRFQR